MLKSTRRLLILAAVLLGLGLAAAPQAEAGWWHRGCGYYSYYGYYGYYGGWGHCGWRSCWSPVYRPIYPVSVCDPCCGWYVRPVYRCYVPYRAYRCCSVCYTDPCCCYDSCSVGDVVSVVDSPSDIQASQKPTLAPPAETAVPAPAAGTPNQRTPARAPTPAATPDQTFAPSEAPGEPAPAPAFSLDANPTPSPAPEPAATPSTNPMSAPTTNQLLPESGAPSGTLDPLQPQSAVPASEGTISILVPENALVTINGYVTKSSGRVRRYVAKNLQAGLVYPFNIQVTVVRDGRTLTDARQVKLSGGALEAVVFNFDKSSVDRIAKAW